MKQKYLFLYLKTGGGHLAPAQSLKANLEKQYGHAIEPVLVDGLTESKPFLRSIIEDGYRKSQSSAQWVFSLLYALHKPKPIARLTARVIGYFLKPYLRKQILEQEPAKIVIFHFFLIRPILDILRENALEIPVITVVTDPFTAHPIWFLEKNTRLIVFSETLKKACLQKGFSQEQLSVFPFILDEKFTLSLPQEIITTKRKELGFSSCQKTILILGGADGMPRGEKILKNLLEKQAHAQIVMVCGHNKALLDKALKIKAQMQAENVRLFGFIDFVHELIQLSDVVITKCGASTFMEILISGKVPVINNYLWEQEKGNMEFVRDNHLGIYEKNLQKLPESVFRLTSNASVYGDYSRRILNSRIKNGTPLVSDFIFKLY